MSILFLVIAFLLLVVLLVFNRLNYEIFSYQKKKAKVKIGAFLTSLIFSDLKREDYAIQIEAFKKTDLFEKKWYKKLVLNDLITLKQNLKGDVTQNIHFIYEQFGLFELSLTYIKSKNWYIKCIGIYHFQALEYIKAEHLIRPYLNSKNKILSANAFIALVSLSSERLDFLVDYENEITLTSEIKTMNILHSKKPPMPQNLNDWIKAPNLAIVRLGLKFMVHYNYLGADKEILLLLNTNNKELRHEVFVTASELFIEGAEEALIVQFEKEQKKNRIAILNTLGEIGTEISNAFLIKLIHSRTENEIKMTAIKGLNKLNPEFLNSNFYDSDKIQRMIKHVKDPYL